MMPQLHYFLYAQSLSDGVDPTRYSDLHNGDPLPAANKNDPNPGRNGEPAGELGLVLQQDAAWHDQTGAPSDPQAGNIPGTQRDVLRSANFSGNGPTAMFASAGTWSVSGGSYQNSTASGDNVSLFDLNTWLPSYYEVSTTLKVESGGSLQNGYIVFDYQSPTDFKYAGIDVADNMLKIGQRTDNGWIDTATLQLRKSDVHLNQYNSILLAANYRTATLTFGKYSLSYDFTAPLNTGMLGFGTDNSLAQFSDYSVQRLPINFTYSVLEDFSDGVADKFTPQAGTWTTTSGTDGRYYAVAPAGNAAALSSRPLNVAPLSYVEYSATVNAAAGATAGLVYDYSSPNDFLYAAIVPGSNEVVLGHVSNGKWSVDATASVNLKAGSDYNLMVSLVDETTNTVNVVLNGSSVTSYSYNYLVHDGGVGLFTRGGNASFDNVLLRGDDVAYAGGGEPLVAASAPAQTGSNSATLDVNKVSAALTEAEQRWIDSGLVSAQAVTDLGAIQLQIADLPGLTLGLANLTQSKIIIDANAAGYGWFIDPTVSQDQEFLLHWSSDESLATPDSPAYGHMDLLTVVEHELGHLLGFQHSKVDVMDAALASGVRISPQAPAPKPATTTAPSLAAALDEEAWWAASIAPRAAVPDSVPAPGPAPVIDWESANLAPSGREKKPDQGSEWLSDFVNHVGQSAAERNPNASWRIELPVTDQVVPPVDLL
jgi:hypothetical protein